MPEQAPVQEKTLSLHGSAFLDTLRRHMDAPVTRYDLLEEHPEIKWSGKLKPTWTELITRPGLTDRLVTIGENNGIMYAMLEQENDLTLLMERLKFIPDHMKKNGAEEHQLTLWRDRAATIGKVATVIAGGVAVGTYFYKRSHRN